MNIVKATFYFKDGTVLYVNSDEGIYNNKTLDMIFKEYPDLQRYMPAVLTTITKYIPSELVDNFHHFEGLLNQFMTIYRSNSTTEEKIQKIQEMFGDMLSNDDIKELFTILDNTFNTMQNNLSNYPKHLLNKNQD